MTHLITKGEYALAVTSVGEHVALGISHGGVGGHAILLSCEEIDDVVAGLLEGRAEAERWTR